MRLVIEIQVGRGWFYLRFGRRDCFIGRIVRRCES